MSACAKKVPSGVPSTVSCCSRSSSASAPASSDDTKAGTLEKALAELSGAVRKVDEALAHQELVRVHSPKVGSVKVGRGADGSFRAILNASQFKSDEMSLLVSGDNLVFEAASECKCEDGSYYSAQLRRIVKLPADIQYGAIKSCLTPDGLLVVEAPAGEADEQTQAAADAPGRPIAIEPQGQSAPATAERVEAKPDESRPEEVKPETGESEVSLADEAKSDEAQAEAEPGETAAEEAKADETKPAEVKTDGTDIVSKIIKGTGIKW